MVTAAQREKLPSLNMDIKIVFVIAVVASVAPNVSGSPYNRTTAESSFGFTFPKIPIGNFYDRKGIIGGRDSRAGEFPFLVSIQTSPKIGEKYHTCGGVIVDATHIVTAAHCVDDLILEEVEIVAGAHNIQDRNERSQQRVQVKRLVYHPKYNSVEISHDGAVITLASPLAFNHRVRPLRLAPLNHEPSGSCVTIGWGDYDPTGGIPDALQKVTLEIVGRETCRTMYNKNRRTSYIIDPTMICASPSKSRFNKGICYGDSGGPLLCSDYDGDLYMAGIVSWSILTCGDPTFPDVFGNVAHMRPFFDYEISRL